jgi:hypothetical protein
VGVFNQKKFKESDKTIGILAGCCGMGDKAAGPIIGSEHVEVF